MASKTSADSIPDPGEPGRVLRMSDLAEALTRRQVEIGPVTPPRNSGVRRTSSKRALLKAIENAGGNW